MIRSVVSCAKEDTYCSSVPVGQATSQASQLDRLQARQPVGKASKLVSPYEVVNRETKQLDRPEVRWTSLKTNEPVG